jgi:hypothetical protein
MEGRDLWVVINKPFRFQGVDAFLGEGRVAINRVGGEDSGR